MDFIMIETGWLSILPPIIAIVLALMTKEVYSSLFIECIVGGIGSIVPPMLILILSWNLGGVCRQLIGAVMLHSKRSA